MLGLAQRSNQQTSFIFHLNHTMNVLAVVTLVLYLFNTTDCLCSHSNVNAKILRSRILIREEYRPTSLWSSQTSISSEGNESADDDPVRPKDFNGERGRRRKKKKKGPSVTPRRERPRVPVLQYHDDWVCVNKPAGMTVHRSKNTSRRQLVLSTLLKRQLARKVFPVHRLDHRTSGAILFAFDSKTCGKLHSLLKAGPRNGDEFDELINDGLELEEGDTSTLSPSAGSDKAYIALLRGDWRRKFGDTSKITVTKPLKVNEVMKDAKTDFFLLASSVGDESIPYHPGACSLVLCKPKTGRTHQIRRHAHSIGFPIIGDSAHGDSKVNRWWRENRSLDRLFLHCLYLDLPPFSILDESKNDERIQCIAPLPPDLIQVVEREDMNSLWTAAKADLVNKCELVRDDKLLTEEVDQRSGTFGRNFRAVKD